MTRRVIASVFACRLLCHAHPQLTQNLRAMETATVLHRIEVERRGVERATVQALATYLGMPSERVFLMLGQHQSANSARRLTGSAGHAAIRLARLVSIARNLVAQSTHPAARDIDAGQWLGKWLEEPSPALGGRCPAALVDTPTGSKVVERVLGAIASGAYQ